MRLTHFDGRALDSPTLLFECAIGTSIGSYRNPVRRRNRANVSPRREVAQPQHRTFLIQCWPRLPDVTFDAFRSDVYRMFDPVLGERELRGLHDGSAPAIAMWLPVDVTEIEFNSESRTARVIVEATDPTWRAVTETNRSSSPITIIGNSVTRPRIEISTGAGSPATRNRYLVTDRTGRGITAWPLFLQTSATEVFVNGVSQPFYSAGGGTWVYVHVHPSPLRGTLIDVYSANEPSEGAERMSLGSLDPVTSSNTEHRYSGWRVSSHPGAASCQWRPANPKPFRQRGGQVTYGVFDENQEFWHARLYSIRVGRFTREFDNDYSGLEFTSPVEISSVEGLLRRVSTGTVSMLQGNRMIPHISTALVYAQVRMPEQENWERRWWASARDTDSHDNTYGSTIDCHGAVQVAVGLETPSLHSDFRAASGVITEHQAFAMGNLMISGNPVVRYHSGRVPEVTHVGSTSARFVNDGWLTNHTTGQSIHFRRVYFDSSIIIDAEQLAIAAATGPDYGKILPTADSRYFDLVPGSNPWALEGDLAGAVVNFTYHEREGV